MRSFSISHFVVLLLILPFGYPRGNVLLNAVGNVASFLENQNADDAAATDTFINPTYRPLSIPGDSSQKELVLHTLSKALESYKVWLDVRIRGKFSLSKGLIVGESSETHRELVFENSDVEISWNGVGIVKGLEFVVSNLTSITVFHCKLTRLNEKCVLESKVGSRDLSQDEVVPLPSNTFGAEAKNQQIFKVKQEFASKDVNTMIIQSTGKVSITALTLWVERRSTLIKFEEIVGKSLTDTQAAKVTPSLTINNRLSVLPGFSDVMIKGNGVTIVDNSLGMTCISVQFDNLIL